MTKTEKATRYMESIAKDDSHGYDQIHRMGPYDFDCSGLNIIGWVEAGVPVNKAVKKTVTVNGNQKVRRNLTWDFPQGVLPKSGNWKTKVIMLLPI
jgi:hypothetical protein